MTDKNMPPLISIIIPVYNHAHTLKRSVESIFRQTYRPMEIIIVNDGSTDNFNDVIREYLPLSKREQEGVAEVKVINQSNQGAPAARNRGFAISKGEYVIFWDADTLARPDMLGKMLNALQKHPEAAYSYSQFKFGWKRIKSQHFDADKLKQVNYIDVTSLIRRSAISPSYQEGVGGVAGGLPAEFKGATEPNGGAAGREAGPFDTSLKRFQDWDLWLSLLEQGKTGVFIPEVLYEKTVGSREGISSWLPSFMYQLPWKTRQVKEYEKAKEIILKKHHLQYPPLTKRG